MASNKTTKEERERIIQAALEAEEELETPEEDEEVEETSEEEAPVVEEPVVEEKPKLPDLEERYKESTRESQVLFAKQKKFTETVEQANRLPEPTEPELMSEYPNWSEMTDTERRLAKDNYINRRKFDLVYEATQEGREIERWAEKVESFLTTASTKYPRLDGREQEFKTFVLKPTRRGLDLEDLTKMFLYEAGESQHKGRKGSLLQSGSAGTPEKPKQEFLNERQAAELRVNNHKLYQKYVKEGKIKIEL